MAFATRGDIIIVRHQHQRGAPLAIQVEQQVNDARASGTVEIAGGLVGEQDRRCHGKSAGDRHALLLSARKLARVMRKPLTQAHAVEKFSRLAERIRKTGELQREHYIFERGQAGQQLETLEHKTDAPGAYPCTAILIQPVKAFTGEGDLSLCGCVEPGQQAKQRRLSRARDADDGNALAGLDLEIHTRQDVESAFGRGNPFRKIGGGDDNSIEVF